MKEAEKARKKGKRPGKNITRAKLQKLAREKRKRKKTPKKLIISSHKGEGKGNSKEKGKKAKNMIKTVITTKNNETC